LFIIVFGFLQIQNLDFTTWMNKLSSGVAITWTVATCLLPLGIFCIIVIGLKRNNIIINGRSRLSKTAASRSNRVLFKQKFGGLY
jgi:hypothetical protein